MTPETLDQALRRLWQTKWKHQASGKSTLSQAERASVAAAYRAASTEHSLLAVAVEDILPEHVRAATAIWYYEGLAPATINKRLSCLSAMGVNVGAGDWQSIPKQPKWWLTPAMEQSLKMHFTSREDMGFMAFVAWTTRTGLRVEESLAIRWEDVDFTSATLRVRGTKTDAASATLPLGEEALGIIHSRHLLSISIVPTKGPFPFTYEELRAWWQKARAHLGAQDEPTATLKALRRSAARYLHVECSMPLHMVQQYLRHESMKTTLEYLRLTGGYGTEELRRYLK